VSYVASNFPNSYRHPLYDEIDSFAEQKVGIPSGALAKIRTLGEKSNADQISEAGARSPYQIIPKTREAIMDKYGIDPWLNPKNAALGAAYLLKEGMQRNAGDFREAVGEYIGGTNRKNWGKQTRDYMDRVSPIDANLPTLNTPRKLDLNKGDDTDYNAIVNAYKTGQMSPEQKEEFESDVQSGKFVVPGGLKIEKKETPAPAKQGKPNELNKEIFDAYSAGLEWERSGKPDDQAPANVMRKSARDEMTNDIVSGMAVPEKSIMAKIKDTFTGESRRTKETEGLPNFLEMPEINKGQEKPKELTLQNIWNRLSNALPEAGATLTAVTGSPEEIADSMKNTYGVESRKDEKGNIIFTSKADGKDYVIPPGWTTDTTVKAVMLGSMFSKAAKAKTLLGETAAMAGTEAAIQTGQAVGGGEFDTADVAISAAAPGAVRAVSGAFGGAKSAIVDQIAPKTIAPTVAPTAATMEGFAKTATQATRPGPLGVNAKQELAAMVKPDEAATAAAGRLGIDVNPVTMTTNPFISQARKLEASKVASPAAVELERETADMAENVYRVFDENLGAKVDTSGISSQVAGEMTSTVANLEKQADELYKTVNDTMPKGAVVPTPNLSEFAATLRETRSPTTLSPGQKKLVSLVESGKATYADLDSVRKQIGQQLGGKESVFKGTETGELKQMYAILAKDQLEALRTVGDDVADTYKQANALVAERKDLEEKIVAYYGHDLRGGIVPAIRTAISSGVKGSDKTLNQLMSTVPQHLRKEVLTSAMLTNIRQAGSETAGEGARLSFDRFNKMYRGMKEQSEVWNTVNSVLGKDGVSVFDDLYKVSNRLEKNLGTLHTGKANQSLRENLMSSQGLLSGILDVGKAAIVRGAATEAVTAGLIGPTGAGFMGGAANVIMNSKRDVVKAVSDVLSSQDFQNLVAHAGQTSEIKQSMVKKFANSSAFRKLLDKSDQFSNEMKLSLKNEASARERLVMSMIQSAKSQSQEE